jgi:hypothetical protein
LQFTLFFLPLTNYLINYLKNGNWIENKDKNKSFYHGKTIKFAPMLSIRPQIAKVAKAREFTYIPRYYDERKEKIADIERKIRQEEDNKNIGEKRVREFHFRSAMANRWKSDEYRESVKRSNITILVLIGAILMLGFYIYKKFDLIELWMQ